jgi:hypothetical protein
VSYQLLAFLQFYRIILPLLTLQHLLLAEQRIAPAFLVMALTLVALSALKLCSLLYRGRIHLPDCLKLAPLRNASPIDLQFHELPKPEIRDVT